MTKYHAQPQIVDGRRFASKLEAKRWQELCLLEKAGEIHSIHCQPRYKLKVNGEVIGSYVADFEYIESGGLCIEDCKGFDTPLSKWKRKHFTAQYGREVRLIRKVRAL